MNAQRALNVAYALILCALLSTSYLLDGPDDVSAEWDQSKALKELQASAAGSARREIAAARLCNDARGPNSEARWTEEGHLVCTTRHGVKPLQVAGGAQ